MKSSDIRILGAVLVAIGVVIFVTKWFAATDAIVAGSVAAVLLVAYALTRGYGLLVPGMIILGAAIATGVQDYGYDETGGFVAVFIGAGFLGIYVVDFFARDASRWWPLIPGSIFAVFGAATVAEGTVAPGLIERFWPLGFVVAGIVVLAIAIWRARRPAATPLEKPVAS